MPYSVRGRVFWGLGCLVLGAGLGGACSGNSTGIDPAQQGGGENGGKSGSDGCQTDDDCTGDSVCRSGECVTACRSDKDCRATDQLCGDDDVCVDCLTDSHCDAGQTCDDNGECRSSSSSGGGGGVPNSSADGGAPSVAEGGSASGGTMSEAGVPGVGEAGTGNLPDNCALETIDPCAGLPRFFGTQSVDGEDGEFCMIPPFELALATTAYYRAPKPPLASTTSAIARVAWSATALHVFIRVTDSTPRPNSRNLLFIWDGDNVELFASPVTPTGPFDSGRSSDNGAFQLIAQPPGGAYYPAGQGAFVSTGSADAASLLEVKVAATATGYVVEAQIPWTTVAPTANSAMGFDMGLSDDVDGLNADLNGYRDHYGLLYNAGLAVGTCSQHYEPYCDSRNWCTPIALP